LGLKFILEAGLQSYIELAYLGFSHPLFFVLGHKLPPSSISLVARWTIIDRIEWTLLSSKLILEIGHNSSLIVLSYQSAGKLFLEITFFKSFIK
jgi:hypothetical protein